MDYIFHPFGTSLCYVDSDNEVVHFYGFVHIWTWFLLIWGILIMLHPLGMSLSTLWTYTVFGCGDFRGDGKHRVENWVENSVFHCLGKRGKPGEKIFSLGPTNFVSPNQEEKPEWKTDEEHIYTNVLSFPTVTTTQQRRKKTIFQPPTQHNPTITNTTQK